MATKRKRKAMKEPLAKKNTKAEMKCMLEGCLVKSEECLCLKCSASETFLLLSMHRSCMDVSG